MAWKEPSTLPIILTAWYLDHAVSGPGATHSAGDKCTWKPTAECDFKVEYAQNWAGPYTQVNVTTGPGNAAAAQVSLTVAVVPFSQPLYIRVTAQPTRKIQIISAHSNTIHRDGHAIPVEVRDVSNVVGYWEGTCYYEYLGGGQWHYVIPHPDTPGTDPRNLAQDLANVNFSPAYTLSSSSPKPTVTTLIHFFLSQVRECTYHCNDTAQVQTWQVQQKNTVHIDRPAVSQGHLQFLQQNIDLKSTDKVLEVKAYDGPRLLAVHWPNQNAPTAMFPLRAPQAEFLIFFHSSYRQNVPGNYVPWPFPFGFDYVVNGLHKYLDYDNPIDWAYPLGIPFSMAGASKKTVLVLPLNREMHRGSWNMPELPNLNVGDQCQALLEEAQCLMLRSQGFYFFDPNIGRLGCGSFSAGVTELTKFHHNMMQHGYLKDALQEVYLFDPIHDNGNSCAQNALAMKAWAGSNANRRVRLYNNESTQSHATLIGRGREPATPYVEDSSDGRFTAGVVTDAQMRNARSRMAGVPLVPDTWDWGLYHANFVTTFLIDAMRKSGFR